MIVRRALATLTVAALAQSAGAVASPTVRVSVVRASESSATRVVLIVRVQAEGMVLGAYQGFLRFDPAVLHVDSATASRDNFRLVNSNDAAKGIIRFNGFTTSGFAGADAVRIVGRMSKPLDAAKLAAELEVAGDLDGKAVPKAGLLASHGVLSAAKPPNRTP